VQQEIMQRQNSSASGSTGSKLNQRRDCQDAKAIIDVLSSTLNKSPDLEHQQAVLQAVWSDATAIAILPEFCKLRVEFKLRRKL